MLTCVYHPIDAMRVLEEDEAVGLLASGVWFDCPKKAEDYRSKLEEEIKQESRAEKPKRKLKEKSNER
jgi:hypothetical protein